MKTSHLALSLASMVCSTAFANERIIDESRTIHKRVIEIDNAFVVGEDADFWGQSTIYIKFDPAVQIGPLKISSVGALLDGPSLDLADSFSHYFEWAPVPLDFEVLKSISLRWDSTNQSCERIERFTTTIVNNNDFKVDGFNGQSYDGYSSYAESIQSLPFETCVKN